ncbi:5-methyltetrahydropteroyltriglutamate--homocysteine S-methyltransferase [Ligilactobacillus salivarius]|uniref:5-methyltetrahydropteroyltriglutamate-- homocysteine S-methyltransferase n=1 Tax=Ligilactobacillus salivarius TaxID=1624 RepID=UPI0009DA786C|nr:5-methyltetrahydropteroyltriglutamate--homocysteine S-methyltransferase [Ligilactobacillus salivarius]OQR08875.1 5-methyltetrahydropteroyltriglutamate--homocysteine methyltransferase [Ligilactobacillus salivarius]
MTKTIKDLAHYDIVGSFLRPEELKKARKDFSERKISQNELKEIEDRLIDELVGKEKEVGLKAVTDGEFSRGWWHIDFLENLDGVEGYVPQTGYNQQFKGTDAPAYNIRVVGKVKFNPDHPFLKNFSYLKEVADKRNLIAKATIPSPTMLYRQEILANDGSSKLKEIYPNVEEFYADLSQTYADAIKAFYDLGCRYLQFDDTNWAFLVDKNKREVLLEKGIDPKETTKISKEIINNALANKPDDLIITTHVCRGNHASSWLFSGGYDAVAEDLFATDYDGYFLEFDDARSGSFEPLRFVPAGKRVVLGLVTSKKPELEDKDELKQKIQEATKYVDLDDLALSTQCGFASTEEGNKLTEKDQENKLKLVIETAKEVWGD